MMKQGKKNKILIAEDDFVVAKNLSLSLSDRGYKVLDIKESGEELLIAIRSQQPDLVILDINLAGFIDGIAVAGQINEHMDIPILYLTSDRDRMTLEKAKLTHPAGYLIKPFDIDELVSAIELGIYNHTLSRAAVGRESDEAMISETHLFVKAKNRLEKVKFEDIQYVEANDIYASLVTAKHTYILSYPLKTIETMFPSNIFMRVHRSFIINLNQIEAIEDNTIQIAKKNIPIGKTHRAELMKRLSII